MSDPKTLKDFKEENNWVNIVDLRKEAIKRAKHYISLLGDAKLSCISYGSPYFKFGKSKSADDMNFIGRIAEIVEFNNLTEEDLK